MSTMAASNGMRPRQLEPLGCVRRQADLVAFARQQRLEDLAHDLLVVDDQDVAGTIHAEIAEPARRARRASERLSRRSPSADALGSASRNRVPCPTTLSQVMVPPCSWTMP